MQTLKSGRWSDTFAPNFGAVSLTVFLRTSGFSVLNPLRVIAKLLGLRREICDRDSEVCPPKPGPFGPKSSLPCDRFIMWAMIAGNIVEAEELERLGSFRHGGHGGLDAPEKGFQVFGGTLFCIGLLVFWTHFLFLWFSG